MSVHPQSITNLTYIPKVYQSPRKVHDKYIGRGSIGSFGCCCNGQCIPEGTVGIAGYNIIHNSRATPMRRLLWAVIVTTMFVFTLYQGSTFVFKFISNPIVTTFSQVAKSQQTVPSISICHNNKFKKSALEPMLVRNKTLTDWLRSKEFSLLDWNRFTLNDLISQASYNLSDMVYYCKIGNDDCHSIGTTVTANYSRQMGLCYTYNTPVMVGESLIRGQVNVVFREPEDLGYFESRGWSVVLHPPDLPLNDFTLAVGVAMVVMIEPSTSIEIRLTKKKTSKIPLEVSKGDTTIMSCSQNSPLETLVCLTKCIDRLNSYSAKACHLPWKTILQGQKPCRSFIEFMRSSMSNVTAKNDADVLHLVSECGCMLPCTYNSYHLSVPYTKSLMELRRSQVIPKDSQEEFGHFSLWIQNVNEIVSERRPYQWAEFSADIGGILGLMLGASLLTVLEILDCISCSIVSKFSKYN